MASGSSQPGKGKREERRRSRPQNLVNSNQDMDIRDQRHLDLEINGQRFMIGIICIHGQWLMPGDIHHL
eukprot:6455034-Amphidinium_carterae.1